MKPITASLINMYHICKREMWLHAHGITMEHTSDLVYEGKQIGETTYPNRAERYRELEMDGIKIDFYDPYNKVVHEIKKSAKRESAHIAQVKYYLYVLNQNGINGATGILEYPKMRQTEQVFLSQEDVPVIEQYLVDIRQILDSELCPAKLPVTKCHSCSYFEFCHIEE